MHRQKPEVLEFLELNNKNMGCCGSGSSKPQRQNKYSAAQAKNDISSPASGKGRSGVSKSSLITGLALVLIAGMAFGYVVKPSAPSEDYVSAIKSLNTDEQRASWIAVGDNLKAQLAMAGQYDCCIANPCNYCLYDEGQCACRQSILAGEHPCGECIGEILEGNGMTELKPYFAKAIAHKVGAQHEEHLQRIIDDMYQ